MFTAEYEGINSFLVGASNLLLDKGVKRNTRGYICWELPAPFIFKINNPTARYVTIKQRKWNSVLPYAESLWLASGRNDLSFIGHYLKNMKDFSDDGLFLRGGYGPRLRRYNSSIDDYKINESLKSKSTEIDQYQYVINNFNRDINTRQAVINIADPLKDCFDKNGQLKETKDIPCTKVLHFMKHPTENKLNLTVYMRSNDILWGASAVNIFNFTFIQEYIAHLVGLDIGEYYHFVNNFHYYESFYNTVKAISNVKDVNDTGFKYEKSFNNLKSFDDLVRQLSNCEEQLRRGESCEMIDFKDEFFNDWYKVLYRFNTNKKVKFMNPILNTIKKKKSYE